MKAVALIGMLLSILLVMYLVFSRLHSPAPETAILGEKVPLVDVPALAKEKLEEAMKLEAERIKQIEQIEAEQ